MDNERKAAQFRHYMSQQGDGNMTQPLPMNEPFRSNNSSANNAQGQNEELYRIGVEAFRTHQPAAPNMVDRPNHYTQYKGFEVMDVCDQLSSPDGSGKWFRGNVFKYLARAGWKEQGNLTKELEDLKKSRHYLDREIARVEKRIQAEDAEKSQGWMAMGADENPSVGEMPRRILSDEQQAEWSQRFETSTSSIRVPAEIQERLLARGVVAIPTAVSMPRCPICQSELEQNSANDYNLECMNNACVYFSGVSDGK